MPFPLKPAYIEEMEMKLKVQFPKKYKRRIILNNGGELNSTEFYFELIPFFDKENNKRIKRTCNHIEKETANARKWQGFPEKTIVIGKNESGDLLLLLHEGDGILKEDLYYWNHETREKSKIANSIEEIEDGNT